MTNKTEMVSVPRELLERVSSPEIGMTAKKDRWAAAHEIRALLAAPAEDVRAVVEEPVRLFGMNLVVDGNMPDDEMYLVPGEDGTVKLVVKGEPK